MGVVSERSGRASRRVARSLDLMGPALLRASRSSRLRRTVETSPLTRKVVTRFVAGEDVPAAITAATALHRTGMTTTLDVLGEDVTDLRAAQAIRDQYLVLLYELHEAGQAGRSEVSLKLSALGQALPGNGHELAFTHAREICVAADAVGCRVTLDMEDHTTVDSSLAIGRELRAQFPTVGTVLQANLRRTPDDIRDLARSGARVRIVKGAYKQPAHVAHQRKSEVDAAYRDAITTLMGSDCYPMVATHDPLMTRHAEVQAEAAGRTPTDWEVQMLFGIASTQQRDLVGSGYQVRTYIPFGADWYGYFMRRLAERPANVAFFLRALATR
jgi:proline dehydrogenase